MLIHAAAVHAAVRGAAAVVVVRTATAQLLRVVRIRRISIYARANSDAACSWCLTQVCTYYCMQHTAATVAAAVREAAVRSSSSCCIWSPYTLHHRCSSVSSAALCIVFYIDVLLHNQWQEWDKRDSAHCIITVVGTTFMYCTRKHAYTCANYNDSTSSYMKHLLWLYCLQIHVATAFVALMLAAAHACYTKSWIVKPLSRPDIRLTYSMCQA